MANALFTIRPYWYNGTWVFDDPSRDLDKEPFVAGIPDMINDLVKDIPNVKDGFTLIFSPRKFPGAQRRVTWLREEDGGNWYFDEVTHTEGWLCPALFEYFDKAPKSIYVQSTP